MTFKKHTGIGFGLPLTTAFELKYGFRGTHIPTDQQRDYIGIKGEVLIDDNVSRDKPYVKIGDGITPFDGLPYLLVVKDYYEPMYYVKEG